VCKIPLHNRCRWVGTGIDLINRARSVRRRSEGGKVPLALSLIGQEEVGSVLLWLPPAKKGQHSTGVDTVLQLVNHLEKVDTLSTAASTKAAPHQDICK